MKVLHLLKTSVGASWALRQIRELVRNGVEVHVALPPGGDMVGKYAALGATEHLVQTDFPIRAPWRFPSTARQLTALVRSITPDLIHSHFVGTTLTMRLALGRHHPTPRIFQVPGPLHLEHPFFRRAEIATAGPRDFWIGSCKWTCDCYRRAAIPERRVFLSYYGTDPDIYTPQARGKLRAELGIPADTRIVGMVAYMYAPKRYLGQRRGLKGHEDLIDAFKICLQRDPQLCCVIVGGAWAGATAYEQSIRDYARQQCGDRIRLLGTRHDVPELYADIDIAVHPSHSENVGGAVESCLLGVPTVATRVGGFPDLIQDGVTGWLVPPRDPEALANAILDGLKNREEAQRRALAGQRLTRQLFDVRRTGAEIRHIYGTILGHP